MLQTCLATFQLDSLRPVPIPVSPPEGISGEVGGPLHVDTGASDVDAEREREEGGASRAADGVSSPGTEEDPGMIPSPTQQERQGHVQAPGGGHHPGAIPGGAAFLSLQPVYRVVLTGAEGTEWRDGGGMGGPWRHVEVPRELAPLRVTVAFQKVPQDRYIVRMSLLLPFPAAAVAAAVVDHRILVEYALEKRLDQLTPGQVAKMRELQRSHWISKLRSSTTLETYDDEALSSLIDCSLVSHARPHSHMRMTCLRAVRYRPDEGSVFVSLASVPHGDHLQSRLQAPKANIPLTSPSGMSGTGGRWGGLSTSVPFSPAGVSSGWSREKPLEIKSAGMLILPVSVAYGREKKDSRDRDGLMADGGHGYYGEDGDVLLDEGEGGALDALDGASSEGMAEGPWTFVDCSALLPTSSVALISGELLGESPHIWLSLFNLLHVLDAACPNAAAGGEPPNGVGSAGVKEGAGGPLGVGGGGPERASLIIEPPSPVTVTDQQSEIDRETSASRPFGNTPHGSAFEPGGPFVPLSTGTPTHIQTNAQHASHTPRTPTVVGGRTAGGGSDVGAATGGRGGSLTLQQQAPFLGEALGFDHPLFRYAERVQRDFARVPSGASPSPSPSPSAHTQPRTGTHTGRSISRTPTMTVEPSTPSHAGGDVRGPEGEGLEGQDGLSVSARRANSSPATPASSVSGASARGGGGREKDGSLLQQSRLSHSHSPWGAVGEDTRGGRDSSSPSHPVHQSGTAGSHTRQSVSPPSASQVSPSRSSPTRVHSYTGAGDDGVGPDSHALPLPAPPTFVSERVQQPSRELSGGFRAVAAQQQQQPPMHQDKQE
uniref:Uncharacterized protein n=1 Tax=Chromera velia CCMP2878 TaxID=1169474 RepID=A0A0G4FMR3_9ALVE|eukprot:Cvel_17842.t1-p1 / transcript=Cvel_17842.t1 / gene=Cvel_17842 / organism=Chromera_velia_CCMP2878 / gene_product=hypothetical protein / transcript_product=hypothetical protein / location=Cvel_scaffold1446:33565-37520(-) / protein_length=827 / sequence_SO=supercontig / SO=protein_coding / is_pseudo=false